MEDIKVRFVTTWGDGDSRGHAAMPEIVVLPTLVVCARSRVWSVDNSRV